MKQPQNNFLLAGLQAQSFAVDQVFRKNNGSDPGTLDPHRAEGVPASNVLRDLYEGLVSEEANGNYIPGVAESWTISDDGKHTVLKSEITHYGAMGIELLPRILSFL